MVSNTYRWATYLDFFFIDLQNRLIHEDAAKAHRQRVICL